MIKFFIGRLVGRWGELGMNGWMNKGRKKGMNDGMNEGMNEQVG